MSQQQSPATSTTPTSVTAAKAVVVLSGGQDSTTCLYWAIEKFGREAVCALSFDYGQRHRCELQAAAKVADMAGVAQQTLPLPLFQQLGNNALIDHQQSIDSADSVTQSGDLPNTFVPGRNLFFLTYAAAWAWTRGIRHIITGVAQTDYSGYPDCRENTLQALEQTLSLGMDTTFHLHTPLMHMTKAETVQLAVQLGAMPALAWSHSCYDGQFPPCGKCPACVLRVAGFLQAGHSDPLVDRALATATDSGMA